MTGTGADNAMPAAAAEAAAPAQAFPHLAPHVEALLAMTREERIFAAQEDMWIGYDQANLALAALEDLLAAPRNARTMNMLLAGRSGNGKSSVIARFRSLHPVTTREEGHALAPVIAMGMPSEPSETRFWSELLNALRIAHNDANSVQRKKTQAESVLAYVQCRMLVIDDIHNMLHGHMRAQKHFLVILKNLTIEMKIPIVAVGTKDAIRTLHTDQQLSSRFAVFGLPKWQMDGDFRRLLASFERLLPLAEKSGLAGRDLAPRLFAKSSVTIGGLAHLLRKATVAAIRDGSERITPALIDSLDVVALKDYGATGDEL